MTTDTLEWRLQYAIEYYAKQHEAMHRIKDRINFLAVLLITPIASAIYFVYAARKDYPSNFALDVPAVSALAISAALLAYAGYKIFGQLAKAHDYPYPQQPSELSKYFNQLPQDGTELRKLKGNMLDAYESIISETKQRNDGRNKSIIDAQRFAAYSTIPLLIAASITFAQSTTAPSKPQEVAITKPLLVKLENPNEHKGQSVEQQPRAVATCSCNNNTVSAARPRASIPPAGAASGPCRANPQ
ncbi:hypothetical protein ACU6VJ_09600 [Sphaerotilus sulfidivorans]|nr:hypothetical protein CQA4T8M7_34690 [Sphaerotilus natans]